VADVRGQVAEVDAEPDHRRLMAYVGDAGDGPLRHGGIPQIALDQVRRRVEIRGPLAMRGRQERVEHADLLPGLQERVDDVRADEAGASGDQDHDGVCNPLVAFRA
jgi:hypothetical protein